MKLEIWESRLAAGLIFVVGIVGFCINSLSLYLAHRLRRTCSQFCYLYMSVAVSDLGMLSMFTGWIGFHTWTQHPISTSRIGRIISGMWLLLFWCAGVFSTLTIAINRYVAIALKRRYGEIFSIRNTKICIAIVWVISLIYCIPFTVDSCEFFFEPRLNQYHYAYTVCGDIMDVVCSAFCVCIYLIVFSFNFSTWLKLKNRRGQQNDNQGMSSRALRRKAQDILFFKQTFLNALVFQVAMTLFHLVSRISNNPWHLFWTKTFFWEIGHATNGLLFMMSNVHARAFITRVLKIANRQPSPTVTPGPTVSNLHLERANEVINDKRNGTVNMGSSSQ